jgi:hypothetical protein
LGITGTSVSIILKINVERREGHSGSVVREVQTARAVYQASNKDITIRFVIDGFKERGLIAICPLAPLSGGVGK